MRYLKTFENNDYDADQDQQRVIDTFIEYMMSVYGKNGYFNLYFNKLTKKDVKKYVYDYVKKSISLHEWGFGDTFDREKFRDLLLFKLGLKKLDELEYDIKKYLNDFEIDVNNYNL
jgi:hypothetical protein